MTNDRFTELLTKYLSDQIGADEYSELEYLMSTDKSLRDQFDYFKAFWKNNSTAYNNSDALFAKIRNRIETPHEKFTDTPKRKTNRHRLLSMAAILIVGIIGFGTYKFVQKRAVRQKSDWKIVKVLPGKKSVITLADGTKVTLNAESTFKYPAVFSGSTRDVYLNGEAFFDVKHDASHPFTVHTAKMNVRDLGTEFDVKSYSNDLANEATLIRGMIEVTLSDRPADRIILKPNEKLIVNQTAPENRDENNSSAAANNIQKDTKYTITSLTYFQKKDSTIVETSWLNNKFVFKDEDFGTLCNRLERWFGITININNADFRDYRFTGSFTKENIREVLDVLSYAEPFHYKETNRTITIY